MVSLFITNQFKTGGVERVFLNIANNLSETIYLLPIHSNFDKGFIDAIPKNVVVLRPNIILKRNAFDIPRLLVLAKYINSKFKGKTIRVINFSDTFTTLLFSFLVNGMEHISWIHCNPGEFPKSKLFKLYEVLFKKCDKVICLCNRQLEVFKEIFSFNSEKYTKKLVICNNLVDLKRIDIEKKQNLDVEFKYIIMVARFDLRSKDYKTLIDAYSKLSLVTRKKLKLVLLGDGKDEETIRQYANNKELQDFIVFPGVDSNPYRWFYNAEFSILSSTNEGFSMVVIESLACSCPVIASNCDSGPSDILNNEEYGFLFPVGDVNLLYKKISIYLTQPEVINKYKEKSRLRVEEINRQGLSALNNILK